MERGKTTGSFTFRDIEIRGGFDVVSVAMCSTLRMAFVQVLRRGFRQDFLQTVKDIEKNAVVSIACVLKNCSLIRPCN